MNHHYPDSYHGYVRGAAGMQNMGYGHGVYDEQMTMGQMGHSRTNYQMPQYQDSGQMHPMMQHQQQNRMYAPGAYMNQMGGNSYGMGAYSHYGMANQANINTPSPMMMGPHGSAMGGFYNHPMDSQTNPRAPAAAAGPNPSYNQNSSGSSMHCQGQMNHMPANQNCSQPPQAGSMPGRGQASHCTSPHGMTPSTHSNSSFQGQGTQTNQTMVAGVQGQQRPVAGSRSGSSMHAIPQHPMRHPTTQQNPQEVADNILQIASSYPTNQTVQVPLKSRHAPYHIPRSPHYSMSSSDHSHSSPMGTHSQQASPAPQPSPTPSTSSVKSPTPSLAPIPNPIPSPGITGLRSPCNQGALTCGPQRSPAHMASSYSGHSQPSPSAHFSPSGNQQNFSPFVPSPTASRNPHTSYPPAPDPNIYPNSDSHDLNPSYSSPIPTSASPHTQSIMPSETSSSNAQFNQQGKGNNPLMSLQKLVMLPETQVVDPKSVVNDACLTSQSNETEEVPKNGDDPAEGCAESSDSSVGCSGQSSSRPSQSAEQTPCVAPTQPESDSKVSAVDISSVEETNTSAADAPSDIGKAESEVDAGSASPGDANGKDDKMSPSINSTEERMPHPTSDLDHKDTDVSKDVKSIPNDTEVERKSFVSEIKPTLDEHPKELGNAKDERDIKANESPKPAEMKSEIKSENERGMSNTEDKSAEVQSESILHSLKRKNGKVNGLSEDVNKSLPCQPPGILSEVPLLVNGVSTSSNGNDALEQDSDESVEKKLQNGFSLRLRSKLRMGEKSSPFIRLTTPCSIAVGADERAMCERFVFRRNEYCHTLRTSRLLCNGRTRQDSTGNGDSDESIENVSDGSFHAMGNPQDGCKKKSSSSSAKINDTKNSSVNSNSQVGKKDSVASNKAGHVRGASNGHISNSNEQNMEASDEDGEVCYYEGVDSTDFFMNTVSSDDSISSSQDGKRPSPNNSTSADKNHQNSNSESVKSKISQEEEKEKSNDNVSSAPSKRTRRSSGQKLQEPVNKKYSSKCISNSSNKESELEGNVSGVIKADSKNHNSETECHENGKITRTRAGKRKLPQPEKERESSNEQHNLPEAVVRLEKSPIVDKNTPLKLESEENSAIIVKIEEVQPIVIDDSSPEKHEEKSCSNVESASGNLLHLKREDESATQDKQEVDNVTKIDSVVKSEVADLCDSSNAASGSSKTVTKGTLAPKRKKLSKKGKKKNSAYGSKDRSSEVTDSFKSMKFSRTLDLMKNQRKKESSNTGPFIRLEGSRSTPNTVSVFNQSSQDSLPIANKLKHNHRQSLSRNVVSTTVHMLSNLSNDKVVMVSSTKFVQNQQWSCAFCSHHSSFRSLGDLFGPYFKEADLPAVESIALEESKKGDSAKDSPKSSNISSSKQSKASPSEKKGSRKRKMSAKPERDVPQEIWLHESCALWAPGVCVIGNRIYGLEDAIKDTAESICSVCKGKGAMIGCLYKGCAMKYHFACAIEKDCYLDEENFSLLCPKHKHHARQ